MVIHRSMTGLFVGAALALLGGCRSDRSEQSRGSVAQSSATPNTPAAVNADSTSAAAAVPPAAGGTRELVVYKTPTCGCCKSWVEHVQSAGYKVVVHDTSDVTAVNVSHGIPAGVESCHTAFVDGYAVVGHVPADLIAKLLRERPKVAGIAVPGMPAGSPGMEMGGRKDPYEVVLFKSDGSTSVYAKR